MPTTQDWTKAHLKRKFELMSQLLRERITEARLKVGDHFTQVVAAAKMGHDQTFISKIETGARAITFVEMEQLAKNYNQPLSYFETIESVEEDNPAFKVDSIGALHSSNFDKRSRKRKKDALAKLKPSPSRRKSAKGP
jgi:hypothetical protein